MKEKRFKLEEDTEWWFVKDNTIKVNEFGYREDLTGEDKYRGLQQDLTEQEVVDKLNELYEENQALKELIKLIANADSIREETSVKEILRNEIWGIDSVAGEYSSAWHDYVILSNFFKKHYGEHWDNDKFD